MGKLVTVHLFEFAKILGVATPPSDAQKINTLDEAMLSLRDDMLVEGIFGESSHVASKVWLSKVVMNFKWVLNSGTLRAEIIKTAAMPTF
jgi:hypothetical protein